MLGRKKVNKVDASEETYLQYLLSHPMYDAFILAVILLNCVALCISDPKVGDDEQLPWLQDLNWFFNVTYVLDVGLMLFAFGPNFYFMDKWHYLDITVSAVSVLELGVPLCNAVAESLGFGSIPDSETLDTIMNTLKLVRVLRPLKVASMLPSLLEFLEACARSFSSVLINFSFLLFAISSMSIICQYLVGDSLSYRCYPDDLSDVAVWNNSYYVDYGMEFFRSKYNSDFCSSNSTCASGFICKDVGLHFETVSADYTTPFAALISNMAFLTQRGWPNIFWAIAYSTNYYTAFTVLFFCIVVGSMMIVNMFPAILVASLRLQTERGQKLTYVKYYTGNKDTVTELEILVWACKNESSLHKKLMESTIESIPTQIVRQIWKVVYPHSYEKAMTKLAEKKAKLELENGPDFITDPAANVGIFPWRPCVPQCRSWDILRQQIIPDDSWFNLSIIALVVINIVLLSLDGLAEPAGTIMFYGEIVCTVVFTIELLVKIVLLGPVLYVDSAFNMLDAGLVIMGVLKYATDVPGFITNLRIIKLLRLLRLYRVLKLVQDNDNRDFNDYTITIGALSGLVVECADAMSNVGILLLMMLFVFSLVGTIYFVNGNPCYSTGPMIGCDFMPNTSSVHNLTYIYDLEASFGGDYTDRMDYNTFMDAFVTSFNVMLFNNWHNVMVRMILVYNSTLYFWYFILLVFLCNYFTSSSLISAVTNVMEAHAVSTITEEAAVTKSKINRLINIRKKMNLREYVGKWKANTIETEEARKQNKLAGKSEGKAVSRGNMKEVVDAPIQGSWIRDMIKLREEHSFYLFAPPVVRNELESCWQHKVSSGYIRYTCNLVVSSTAFAFPMWIAVVLAVALALTDNNLGNDSVTSVSGYYCLVMFMIEMLLKMIGDGFYQYFTNFLNGVDFLNNVAIVLYMVYEEPILAKFRIVRLVKLPMVMKSVSTSHSLKMFLDGMAEAPASLFNLIIICFCLIYFMGVIGLQTWLGSMDSCSYDGYPGGQSRDESTAEYPHGCNGDHSVPNQFGYFYTTDIYWATAIESYNDIFASWRSTFRVFMLSNFQGILYSTMDITGENLQPKENSSRQSFIFFLILSMISMTCMILFLSIIYYHYLMTSLRSGRKYLFGETAALWCCMEDKLLNMETDNTAAWTKIKPDKTKRIRYAIWNFIRGKKYNTAVTCAVVIPFFMLVSVYYSTYANDFMMWYEVGFNCLYIFEYCMRLLVMGQVFYKNGGPTEFIIACGLIFFNFYIVSSANPGEDILVPIFVRLGCIIRCFRLVHTFPEYMVIYRTLIMGLSGVVPTLAYMLVFVVIYAVIGNIVLGDINPNWGDPFLQSKYDFSTYLNAFITLLAMGTGNIWTEIIDKLKDGQDTWMQIFIEFYATSFYIVVTIVIKSFALMIISKYLKHSGGSLGLAGQQIRQYRAAWSRNFGIRNSVTIDEIYDLLRTLKLPLGLKNRHFKFVVAERFLKKVMLCMPGDGSYLEDDEASEEGNGESSMAKHKNKHKKSKSSRRMFSEEQLKEEGMWKIKDKFSFRQIVIAVHKNFIDPPNLSDDIEFEESREAGRSMLRSLTYALGRMSVIGSTSPEDIAENPNIVAYKALSAVQRIDLPYFKETFLAVMNHRVLSVKALIRSKGFKPYYGWMLSLCRAALVREKKSAELQFQVKKRINEAMQGTGNSRLERDSAMNYLASVNQLLASANYTYTRYVNPIWDANSMQKVQTKPVNKYIRAVKLDNSSNIYAAVGRTIRIFRCTSGNSEVKPSTKMVKMPSVTMDEHVHDIAIFDNARRIFVAAGNVIETLMLDKSKRGGLHFKKHIKTLKYHTRPVLTLAVTENGAQVVSAGEDGYICLWAISTTSLLANYYVGSSVYCSVIMSTLARTNLDVREALLTEVVCCGAKNGQVVVLPMPLARKKAKEGLRWDGLVLKASEYPCTAITERWGFLYAGFADGTVKIWALTSNDYDSRVHAAPINALDFLQVDSQIHHNGVISGITFAGEHLFSASHDFSYVTWRSPEDVSAVKPGNFKQGVDKGHVFHEAPITSIDANKNVVVTADEAGKIIITAPKRSREQLEKQKVEDLSSSVHFSFVDYDFQNAWCSHQNAVVEEEAYLTVTNRGVREISVRCLLNKHPNFSVELSSVNYHVATVRVGAFNRSVYILPPKGSATFRIVFSPTESRLYNCAIDFMLGETEKTIVHVKGMGTMPQVVVQNRQALFDFKTVEVGETSMQMIKITNYSAKTLVASQVDQETVTSDRETGEKTAFRLADRRISILPRTFHLAAGGSTYLYAAFAPEEEYSTFETPVVYNLAGAEYTLTTLRMRATKRRVQPALKFVDGVSGDETKEESDNEGKKDAIGSEEDVLTKSLGASAMSKLVGINESKRRRLSATIATKTKYEPKMQPRDLRLLANTEYLARSTMLEDLLRSKGWSVREEDDLVLLIHPTSGVFLEVPVDAENYGSMDAIDELEVKFNDGDQDIYYELWHHTLLLERGFAKKGSDVELVINSNQLTVEAIQSVNDRDEVMLMDATGTIDLDLMIFSVGAKPRNPDIESAVKVMGATADFKEIKKFGNLIKKLHILANKGFRLDYDHKSGSWAFLDRLNVAGITRVLHYSADGRVCCEESFGSHILDSGKVSTAGSADYANVNIHVDLTTEEETIHNLSVVDTLRNVKDAAVAHRTYLRFKSNNNLEDETDVGTGKKALNIASVYDHKVCGQDGTESIEIHRPVVNEVTVGSSRTITVEALCNRLERSKLVRKTVGQKHSFYAHTTHLLELRARAADMAPRNLYPHVLSCHHGSITVNLKLPPTETFVETALKVDGQLDKVCFSTRKPPALIPTRTSDALEMINGWYWVLDSGALKLVSPTSYAAPLEGEEASVVQQDGGNYSEIILTAHGFDRIRQDGSILRSGNGYITPLPLDPAVRSHESKYIRNFDCDGRAIPPSHVSTRFKQLWDRRVHDQFIDSVKLGFVRLLEKQQTRLRNAIENETNKLNARLEEIKDAAKERGTSMTPAELSFANEIKDAIDDLNAALDEEKTPEKVLTELARTCSAHAEATRRRNSRQVRVDVAEQGDVGGDKADSGDVEESKANKEDEDALSTPTAGAGTGSSSFLPEVKFVNGRVVMPELQTLEGRTSNNLELSILLSYLREITLPGRSNPLSKSECDACFRDLELEFYASTREMVITPELFKQWFNDDTVKKELAQVTDKTFFAILEEEAATKNAEGETEASNDIEEDDVEEDEQGEFETREKEGSGARKSIFNRFSKALTRIAEKKGRYEIDGFGDDVEIAEDFEESAKKPKGKKGGILQRMFSWNKKKTTEKTLDTQGDKVPTSTGRDNSAAFVDTEAVDYEDSTRAAARLDEGEDDDESASESEDEEEFDESYDEDDDEDEDEEDEEDEDEEEEEESYSSEPEE